MESTAAVNDDFNLSTAASTTVLELAEAIWDKVHGDGRDVPLRVRPAVRARRPDARPRRPQGDARSSASRRRRRSRRMLDEVIPWIRPKSRPAGCEPAAARALRGAVRGARGQRQSGRVARDRRATSSATSTRAPRSSTSPAIAATSSGGSRRRSAGRPTSATCRRSCRPTSGSSSRPGSSSREALPTGHFGTVFMSNYLEHLASTDEVIEQLRVARDAARAGRSGHRPPAEHPAGRARATGTSSTTRSP